MSEHLFQNFTHFWIDTTPGYFEYTCVPLICLFGFISNLTSLYLFHGFKNSKKIKQETQLYKYLKLELVIISLNLFLQIVRFFFSIKSFQSTLVYNIYLLYFLWFLPAVLELMALVCHTASTMDYYMLVKETSLHANCRASFLKTSFIYKIMVILILSVVTFSYLPFCHEVDWIGHLDSNSSTKGFYAIKPKDFNRTTIKKIIEIISYLIRDFIIILILILMNVLIYFQVKNALKNKKKLLYNSKSVKDFSSNKIKYNSKLRHANKKIILMVVITSLNNIFGRIPILFYFIQRNVYEENEILGKIGVLAIYISYSLNFFIFLLVNKRFRSAFIMKYRTFSIYKVRA